MTAQEPLLAVVSLDPQGNASRAGVAAINLSHYTPTCIDPSNPDLLWTYQAYANSTVDRQWCTA